MNLSNSFATTLKKYRNKKNLTQETLASLCSLDRTYISLFERSKRKPTLHVVFKICEVLEIKPSNFIKEIEIQYNKVE